MSCWLPAGFILVTILRIKKLNAASAILDPSENDTDSPSSVAKITVKKRYNLFSKKTGNLFSDRTCGLLWICLPAKYRGSKSEVTFSYGIRTSGMSDSDSKLNYSEL